ncbi:hypothetical protein NEMBOFW57_003033 [Staphylotrichum longicolle]|uniref:Aminoglycoside phosphotransferase domain-containing protein n=1 Tax=Staphylotrichum longicolle TaxID=669026 RepID=A0AAD4F951_9PEZI|nr:hypothetical protein NEMBOFW57_003033 [Staphylotrichum longicolle]
MAPYDNIADRNAQDERIEFARRLINNRSDLITLLKGSFNIGLIHENRGSGEKIVLRFPCTGTVHAPWREEKVRNEVAVLEYLREKTSIPVPRVLCWGPAEESPYQLGPFIIMDFMEGVDLSEIMETPGRDKDEVPVLNPNIDNEKLDYLFEQIAVYLLELSRLEFPRIGAISKDVASGEWTVADRPLTWNMNELVTLGDHPAEELDGMEPYERVSDSFLSKASHFKTHLERQRNVAQDDEKEAWDRFVARRVFEKLIPVYNVSDGVHSAGEGGRFRLFCDDMRPTNMLVDPETLRITAVLDWEFTNAMPAHLAADVPSWLLLKRPNVWLDEDKTDEFVRLFKPRAEQFIRAVERVETREQLRTGSTPLSAQVRDSWESGRFWLNFASRCCFDVDEVVWEFLQGEGRGEAMLDESERAQKARFVKHKMEQFQQYLKEKESDPRFAKAE